MNFISKGSQVEVVPTCIYLLQILLDSANLSLPSFVLEWLGRLAMTLWLAELFILHCIYGITFLIPSSFVVLLGPILLLTFLFFSPRI